MEAIQAKSNVCPRCSGTGELRSCAHVKGGVCFACWGCGSDLAGEIREAQRALSVLRGRWVKARRAAQSAQALGNLVVEGKKAARLVVVLLADREALASKYKSV